MPSYLSRQALTRRALLRGAGASLALPWLEAMAPACTQATPRPLRFVFVFAPNGKKMDEWRPAAGNGDLVLPYLLEPLGVVRERVLVPGNLALNGARAQGDGPGDHARAAGAFLTCAHPKKTGGADILCGVSIDQELAAITGQHTRLPSLELGMERGRAAGVCDSGYSCAYSNNISWKSATTPVAKEVDPRAAFARLFGSEDPATAAAARAGRQSLLDVVRQDAGRLTRRLGVRDRDTMADYLDAVREVERRLQRQEEARQAPPAELADAALDDRAKLRLLYAIVVLALRADATRVVTFMLGNAGSNRSYPFLQVPEGHHDLSHHGGQADKLAKIRRINRFHIEEFAAFCQRLGAVADGEGSLLDHCVLTYGSGIADGNSHAHHDLPFVVVGGRGRVRGGRAVRPARETPVANLYLTYLHWAGAERASFADSTGPLAV